MYRLLLFILYVFIFTNFSYAEMRTDRIIVKLKKKTSFTTFSKKIGSSSVQKISKFSAISQSNDDLFSLQLDGFKNESELKQIIEGLKSEIDAEYIEPSRIAKPALTIPNDGDYHFQWNIQSSTSYPSAVNMPTAWDITRGSTSSIVAVLDTGILTHVDLSSSRILPGYDMISNLIVANDGNLRDPDPTDPGDWCSASERNTYGHICYDSCAPNCTQINSSWHGLFVSGIIAADTNNSNMLAGINWNGKILPVRVLGKGGGYEDDIADAIIWASGGSVSGVPPNPNPARVISMSLSGEGSCSITIQNAINFAVSRGAVVVAAGNETSNASNYWPGNCSNVITVAALNRNGSRASYSNYGSVIFISAPGGDNDGYPIYSLLNGGETVPLSSIFDTWGWMYGTSMATPHVSAVVSLMLSLKPNLTRNEIIYNLQRTARSFPVGSTCNTSICGVGMIDAYSALNNLIVTLSSTTPNTAENSGNVSISIWGKGFLSGASVRLKKTGSSDIWCSGVNVVNLNQINCSMNLLGASTGQWSVEVINIDGSSSTLSNYFTITGFSVSTITPSSAYNSDTNVVVTISGIGFTSPMTVRLTKTGYSDINCSNVTVINQNTATCSLNLVGAFSGLRDVFIANGNGRVQTLTNGFSILNAPSYLSSITPNSGYNDTSVSIAIRGSGFYQNTTARLVKTGYSDINCSTMIVYSSTFAVCVANLYGAFSGLRNLVVNTGTSTLTGTDWFNILNTSLYIYSLNPPSALNTSSSVNVYINGKGFTSNTTAKLSKTGYSDIFATNYQVLTSTYMITTFNILNAPAGKRNFVVYYGTTSYSKSDGFTIIDAVASPVIYTIQPQSEFNNINPVINIYGDNFVGGASLRIVNSNNEISVSNFNLISSTAIINAVLPLKGYPQGKWGVKVINPDGKSYTLSDAFTLLEISDDVRVYKGVIGPNDNQEVKIVYDMPNIAESTIIVYDNGGHKVRNLYKGTSQGGLNEVVWDGKDDDGSYVKSGIYIIEIKTPFYKKYKRVVVVR